MHGVHRRRAPIFGAIILAACAHAEFESSDPATEVALRLDDITSAEGEPLCAAQRVDSQRMVEALFGIRTDLEGAPEAARWYSRSPGTSGNLSQISSQAAAAYARGQQASGERREGEAGAAERMRAAQAQFNRYLSAASGSAGVRRVSAGGPRASTSLERRGAAADYSTVWLEYFYRRDVGVEAGGILEWLRSRSQTDLEALRSYHDAFREALELGCDRG